MNPTTQCRICKAIIEQKTGHYWMYRTQEIIVCRRCNQAILEQAEDQIRHMIYVHSVFGSM